MHQHLLGGCQQRVVEDARGSIREGESIAAPLKRSGAFPPIVTQMIAIGERSGQLEQMLVHVDAGAGRAAPAPADLLARVAKLTARHSAIPTPYGVGKRIALPR